MNCRRYRLDQVANFRDLGGYACDGGVTRYGVIFRSTALNKATEEDIEKIQEVMDSGRFQPQQRMAWENFGVAFGTILVNEMEGMEWVTVIDGKEEYPALQFMNSDMLIDPAAIVWNKAKKNLPCDLKAEFKKIKREAEAVLDDIN